MDLIFCTTTAATSPFFADPPTYLYIVVRRGTSCNEVSPTCMLSSKPEQQQHLGLGVRVMQKHHSLLFVKGVWVL